MKNTAKSFNELIVWQKAHHLVLDIYRISENFPSKEIYGITSQLRRAAISVPANITEGFKKKGWKDKVRFYNIAQGSLDESHYYLILANDLGYCNSKDLIKNLEEVSRLLEAYRTKIVESNNKEEEIVGKNTKKKNILDSGF